jgi:predicted alpha/beta superfamily hydrolase
MSKLLIAAILLGSALLLQGQAKPSAKAPPGTTVITSFDRDHTVVGWLEVFPFESKILHNTRMIRVLLPANYFAPHNASRTYPVLYMQDGQNIFDEATAAHGEWHMDETVEHLVGSFKIPPMMVIGIDNAGAQRATEYLPYPDSHNTEDKNAADAKNLHGDEYARFLVTELMPYIEKHYRVARGALSTGLGGSSYGGVISLYTALKYPGIFGRLLVESPPLWIGDDQLLKDVEKAKRLPLKIYVGVGTKEGQTDPEEAKLVVDKAQELEKILRKEGMGATRLKVVVDEGAEHNEAAWSQRLPDALLFLYGK